MIRNLARLSDETFDAVVIGGGIYGLWTAHALTTRGFSVALLERRDFSGATSFNSLKTVHGGIRALQHGSFADTRQFVRERRALATLAPHLLRVMPFVVPTARHPVRNRTAMRVFLRAYDAVAADRNHGVDPALHLPPSYTVGPRAARALNPLVDPDGLTGAAVWHDYQLHSPERLAIALVRTITEAGAAAANYVEARGLLKHADRVSGVQALDLRTGASFDVRGRLVINASGPWAWQLLASCGIPVDRSSGFSLALNLVLDHPPRPHALGGVSKGRFLFLVPWRDRSILGTSHEGFVQGPDPSPVPADISALLRDGVEAFPHAGLNPASIRLVHRGLLPARPAAATAHGALLKRSIVRDHRADGVPGLLTVAGVRYTTARATAQQAADLCTEILGRPVTPPALAPLAGAAFNGLALYRQQGQGQDRFVARYGTLHTELPADGRDPIAPDIDVTSSEILYAIRREMALTLSDVTLRRTDLAAGGHPGADALRAAASVMAAECGWTTGQTADEIQAVERELTLETPAPSARKPSG
ncbi:MAG: FAD-dependent oxidoreductase [Acidobacteria bacterium]|nr:FAD-dependent oxidoreductase [Acidobacteriota bacterium]